MMAKIIAEQRITHLTFMYHLAANLSCLYFIKCTFRSVLFGKEDCTKTI